MNKTDLLRWGLAQLSALPEFEVTLQDLRLLLSGLDGTGVFADLNGNDPPVTANLCNLFQDGVYRLLAGEPLAYVLGWQEFYGQRFSVQSGVLVPRADSESLIRAALDWQKSTTGKIEWVADFGAGSGCLGLSLGLIWRDCQVSLFDSSPLCLKVAEGNAVNLSLSGRVNYFFEDLTQNLVPIGGCMPGSDKTGVPTKVQFDLVISNPPYIAKCSPWLSPQVKMFEPAEALFSEEEGLFHIRCFLSRALSSLRPKGAFICEIGFDQREAVARLLSELTGIYEYYWFMDLEGRTRGFVAVKD